MVNPKDVAVFEPLLDYLRTSLEAYQKKHGYEAAKSKAMRATLDCLLNRLEETAPSNGIGTGKKAALPNPQQQSSLVSMAGRNAEADLAV